MCGEKCPCCCWCPLVSGSPPRVRGKEDSRHGDGKEDGITPACAGKSRVRMAFFLVLRDHPRVCGEKSTTLPGGGRARGSPPRVRGKAKGRAEHLAATGITPACAGKRTLHRFHRLEYQDHPRVCGEKAAPAHRTPSAPGSPPRVRGKVSHTQPLKQSRGITPACAGKRFFQLHSVCLCWDHPRVCGEKSGNGRRIH